MLLNGAVGDAYGAGYECVSGFRILEGNDATNYRAHPTHGLPMGHYTDDTQMSLAIAEAMLSDEIWTPLLLADHFVKSFHRDPRSGYARRFQAFLEKTLTGREFLDNIIPISDRSGASMRAPAIGLYSSIGEVLSRCRIQAVLTHNTTSGTNAALASALLTHYFAHQRGPKAEVGRFIARHVPGPWDQPHEGPVGLKGWQSVQAAITSVIKCSKMTELLKTCVAWTGDVDTVAAIAMPAGSLCEEIEQDLPMALYDQLENGRFGRDYIAALDEKMSDRFAFELRYSWKSSKK